MITVCLLCIYSHLAYVPYSNFWQTETGLHRIFSSRWQNLKKYFTALVVLKSRLTFIYFFNSMSFYQTHRDHINLLTIHCFVCFLFYVLLSFRHEPVQYPPLLLPSGLRCFLPWLCHIISPKRRTELNTYIIHALYNYINGPIIQVFNKIYNRFPIDSN